MPEGHRNIHIASFMLAFYLVWENDDCDYDDDYDDDDYDDDDYDNHWNKMYRKALLMYG